MKHPITLSLLAIAIFIVGAAFGDWAGEHRNTKYVNVVSDKWCKP